MKKKFNAYTKTIYDFLNEIYVECPNCKAKAIVRSNIFDNRHQETKIVCTKCSFNKALTKQSRKNTSYQIGAAVDPYFALDLWLKKELADGLLWAYNYEHLGFIEKHIAADLRFRSLDNISNKSIASRLPKWMSSKKNRAKILKEIAKLKEK